MELEHQGTPGDVEVRAKWRVARALLGKDEPDSPEELEHMRALAGGAGDLLSTFTSNAAIAHNKTAPPTPKSPCTMPFPPHPALP